MDILKDLLVSAYPSGKESVKLTFYFDSGSPYTFIHKSAGERLGNLISLTEPEVFSGLGNGSFKSSEMILMHVKLLEFWCRQIAYVVDQDILEPTYDILAGHDFMQLYGIRLYPEKGDIEIDQRRVSLSQKVRMTTPIRQHNKQDVKNGKREAIILFADLIDSSMWSMC